MFVFPRDELSLEHHTQARATAMHVLRQALKPLTIKKGITGPNQKIKKSKSNKKHLL
jgi:hypothetical protein